jgi:hypothetical protein
MEIAHDLAEGGAAEVRLSVRTPPNMIGRGGTPGELFASVLYLLPPRIADVIARLGRRMEIGDLAEYGLPVPAEGLYSRLQRIDAVPAILPEEIVESIKQRRFEVVAGVDSLDGARVRLADGEHLEPDVVICATGYRCGLESLVGKLGVLDERGVPKAVGGRPAAPGLRFVGYVPRPAGIYFAGREARRAARGIAREMRSRRAPQPRRATASASARS